MIPIAIPDLKVGSSLKRPLKRCTVKDGRGEQRKKTPLVPENYKKRRAYQALKATQAKQVLLEEEQRKENELRFK